ncbi:MarR family winged helix-turn-helix transcriptional regulator [Pseudonocardia sp. N23]|uniref:MarR family winged helix-turn-helix transcriptional regulator n=1 Tax=Pseudonocardia sp. N23 TaxID=1987376 RepID=UPI000C0317EC|nr:MarR family transcriptional regulator [Pseudonocardia sp. N23]GAY11549.1 transcriptional regulator, MarR family [Pseudonocardia sp. N23]
MSDPVTFDPESVARLRRAIVRLARVLNASAISEDLTPSQASVLAIIGFRGPIGPTEVARFEGINPTMLSRIVTKLDSAGLIRRTPHPTDQRAALLEATDAGRAATQRIREKRSATVTAVLADMPATMTAALLAALPAMEDLADGFDRTAETR